MIHYLRQQGVASRPAIAAATGLSRSTVSGIVGRLLAAGVVRPGERAPSRGGRPAELLAFNPDCRGVVGVKVQPGAVLACLANLHGQIRRRARVELPVPTAEATMAAVLAAYQAVTGSGDGPSAGPLSPVLGVGVAISGVVDPRRGVSVAPHFFAWSDLPLATLLASRLGVPVWMDNDARVGALGEKWAGAGRDVAHFLFITVGVGIGGSLVLEGRLAAGDLLGAGHIGHTRVAPDGPPCRCGRTGCLDTVANDEALARYAAEAGLAGLSAHQVLVAAATGDPRAQQAVDRVATYLAIAIGNAVKLTGVGTVVVAGEAAVAGGPAFLESLRRHLRGQVLPEQADQVRLVAAALGNDVWLVGAAALVLEEVFRQPLPSQPWWASPLPSAAGLQS